MKLIEKFQFLQTIKQKLIQASSNLVFQIIAGIVLFITSGVLVWNLTDVPTAEKPRAINPVVKKKPTKPVKAQSSKKPVISADKPLKAKSVPGEGGLEITSTPPGADISIDDKLVGQTPFTLKKLPAGMHRLKLEKLFHVPINEAVTVIKGIVSKRNYKLAEGEGRLSILSSPSDATVVLDGKVHKEKTPTTIGYVKAGKHRLEMSSGPCARGELEFEVLHNLTVQIDLILDGADETQYEGECLTQEEIFLREEEKRLAEERLEKAQEEEARKAAEAKRREEERLNQVKIKEMLASVAGSLESAAPMIREWWGGKQVYRDVIAMDADNAEARQGLQKIAAEYVRLADAAIARYDWKRVDEYLLEAKELHPELESIAKVRGRLEQGRAKERLRRMQPVKTWREPTTGMEFVWIHDGCFTMGSKTGSSDEKPLHEACVSGFWISRYEVTNAQYRKYAPQHNSKSINGHSLNSAPQPVVYVSWEDGQGFARWLSDHSGYSIRLPTEAEWEYAARGGSDTEYYWGDSSADACEHGNVLNPSTAEEFGWTWDTFLCEDGYQATAPVGSFAMNGFGLYDMLGNACEWVQDWYDGKYYANSPRYEPKGPEFGVCRGARGGCWNNGPDALSSADRRNFAPDYRMDYVGLRLVRQP